jgi:hypothetical protein
MALCQKQHHSGTLQTSSDKVSFPRRQRILHGSNLFVVWCGQISLLYTLCHPVFAPATLSTAQIFHSESAFLRIQKDPRLGGERFQIEICDGRCVYQIALRGAEALSGL